MLSRPTSASRTPHLLLILALIAVNVAAQLPAWNSIAVSGSQTIQLEQTLMAVTDGNVVRAWSALTRNWSSITATYGPPVNTILNEHLIVRDGPIFYGYSPRSGAFQAQFVFSPSPMLVPSASAQTWHSLVIDGNNLHAYFAYSGQWMTYSFPSPPTVTTAMNGRFCFLIQAGGNLYAVSTFYGSLVPAPVPSATSAGGFGNMAFANAPGTLLGFSASRNTWASLSVAGTPTITTGNAQPALVAINDGAAISLFSGNTGTFTTLPASPSASVNIERYSGVVVDGATAYGYSAILGAFATLPLGSTVTVIKQQMFTLLDDGVSLTAFSATTGTFGTPVGYSGQTLLHKAQIATLTPAGASVPSAVYSSYRNQWESGPGLTAGTTYLTAVSVIVEGSTGGLWGWSHRSAGWRFQPALPTESAVAGSSPPNLAETFCARQGTTLHAFNPRTSAWRSTITAAPATIVRAHHAAILAQDGAHVYGFNLWSDEWASQTLQGPYVAGSAQVESAYASDGARIYAYAGLGQMNTLAEFPDFYRVPTLGSLFRFEVAGEPGAAAIIGLALGPAEIPIAFGTLLLDPASLSILAQASVPPAGLLSFTMQIPLDPALRGLTPHLQAALVDVGGAYLTNSIFSTIY